MPDRAQLWVWKVGCLTHLYTVVCGPLPPPQTHHNTRCRCKWHGL